MSSSSTWVAVEEAMHSPESEGGRLSALERLYLRREAVDALIRSLEAYQLASTLGGSAGKVSFDREFDQSDQVVNVQFSH
jgi:hypothetical protein